MNRRNFFKIAAGVVAGVLGIAASKSSGMLVSESARQLDGRASTPGTSQVAEQWRERPSP